ncbi:pectate lyase [Sclerotinia borealis F-4128]|uniref:Pectate lyase n=1 Tax=Sclerotinia borealis (strain F-4128) TaxID=1432307 RepID=W9CTW8_SCLBF|nr:pectate lyase [Sclerotinia borealis F-4128]
MQFSYAQLAILAMALGVASAAPTMNLSGVETRDADRIHFRQLIHDRKTSDDDDSSSSSGAKATTTKKSSKSSKTSTKASASKATGSSSFNSSGSSGSNSSSAAASTITSSASSSNASTGTTGNSMPASSGSSALSAVQTIAAGESFDGGMFVYDRGVSCTGQSEGGDSDAVFQIEAGGSLSNVIIGANQIEGVHCQGGCTLTNVWWSAVCEDAFTIKKQDAGKTTTISGGGAFGADDKVLQHNGAGTLSVSDFTVDTFGKLYRSCGNCDSMYERHVIMDSVTATSGSELAGINYNYGDTATFTNIVATDVDDICVEYTGTDDNNEEPTEYKTGADGTYCIYSTSDVTSS